MRNVPGGTHASLMPTELVVGLRKRGVNGAGAPSSTRASAGRQASGSRRRQRMDGPSWGRSRRGEPALALLADQRSQRGDPGGVVVEAGAPVQRLAAGVQERLLRLVADLVDRLQ